MGKSKKSHHKEKKKSKHKKKKNKSSSSDNSDASSVEMEWVEASQVQPANAQRDSWMSEEAFVSTYEKNEILSKQSQKLKQKEIKLQEEKKIQEERELNPYLKDQGKGLPEKEVSVENLELPSSSVGDGGYSWLRKAYRRIQEQSREENRSMEEIAVERWGSLEKLESLLEQAKSRMEKNHADVKRSYSDRWKRKEKDKTFSDPYIDKKLKLTKPFEDDDLCFQNSDVIDRSIKYNKPKEKTYHHKSNHFSTVKQKSHHKEMTDNLHVLEESEISKTRKEKHITDEELNSNQNNKHFPSWKKSKSNTECRELDSNRDYRNRHPAWKKLKPDKDANVSENSTLIKHDVPSSESTNTTPMSNEDIEKLAAKYLKAELKGDMELAAKLKQELDSARKLKTNAAQQSSKQEIVLLTKKDSSGLSRPLTISYSKEKSEKRSKNEVSNKKLLEDQSKYSLKQMFEREKLTTIDDHAEMFMDIAAKSNSFTEDDYEIDTVSEKTMQKLSHSYREEKDFKRAIFQHQKFNSALDKCEYCLDKPQIKKHLIIDMTHKIYLSYPNYHVIAEGHCLIVPKNHVPSFLNLDEDEWAEVVEMKNKLRKFFDSQDKYVTFIETSMNFRHYSHAFIECIPVPKDTGELAPLYFKKAIQESETEWAHNKKLITLENKDLRHSIPKGLPYFHVEFDPKIHSGFAHVIEEEKYFPKNFGKEVLGGMLDIDYNYLFKNRKCDPSLQMDKVVEYQKMWRAFNKI